MFIVKPYPYFGLLPLAFIDTLDSLNSEPRTQNPASSSLTALTVFSVLTLYLSTKHSSVNISIRYQISIHKAS